MEERDSKIQQRSAPFQSIILKRIYGAAGTNYFVLLTPACPPIGIFDTDLNNIKVILLADTRSVEERDSELQQRSALFQSIILKRIYGAAGTNYFVLLTPACPPIGIFDTDLNNIKVILLADTRSVEERDSKIRQRSAPFQSIILKRIYRAAGTDYFVLLTPACPPIGIFDTDLNSIKVILLAGA
ncbi:hypothetical protein [Ignatzschineria cameli]|uniref:hypothetical protein n=1 Tax=Ignatzschineria cameli TaxID=2182793 RepID=UPI000D60E11A|nr:hypothetical protein [Ignatzschineria cameli]PWD86119.1 hypothetical protein DC080_05065 [Ignatzschineria cameli]